MKLIQKVKYTLSLIGISSLLMMSCEEDLNTGLSPLEATSPTVTITSDNVGAEGGTVPITVTLSEPQIVDVPFYIFTDTVTNWTGDEPVVPNVIVVEKGNTTATGLVEFPDNSIPNGNEGSIELTIGDNRSNANTADFTPQSIVLSANSYDIEMTWDDCDADMDLLFFSGGEDIGFYDAATSDCPENLNMTDFEFEDGTYSLYIDWYNEDDTDLTFNVVEGALHISNNAGAVIEVPYSIDRLSGTTTVEVAQVQVSGDTYSIYDLNNNLLGVM